MKYERVGSPGPVWCFRVGLVGYIVEFKFSEFREKNASLEKPFLTSSIPPHAGRYRRTVGMVWPVATLFRVMLVHWFEIKKE